MSPRAKGPILIVDDSAETQYVLGRLLHAKGYATTRASNGEEALRYLRAGGAACLIVLDMHMPVMDGRSLCRELQADPALAAIPVVAYSSEEAHDVAGIATYVQKTGHADDLLAMVERHCLKE